MRTFKRRKKNKKVTGLKFSVENIFVSSGYSVNLGNYESFKDDAGTTIKANIKCNTKEERDNLVCEMFAEGSRYLTEYLNPRVKAARNYAKSRGVPQPDNAVIDE